MEITRDDFRRHFELLSDESLLATDRDELVDTARSVYDEELERRGLTALTEADPGDDTPAAIRPGEGEELVLIATYNIPDEAGLARGLLQSAEIPFILQNDMVALGGIELRLMVPKRFEEEALEILQHELTEEELAAQAEEAGFVDQEFEPEEEGASAEGEHPNDEQAG